MEIAHKYAKKFNILPQREDETDAQFKRRVIEELIGMGYGYAAWNVRENRENATPFDGWEFFPIHFTFSKDFTSVSLTDDEGNGGFRFVSELTPDQIECIEMVLGGQVASAQMVLAKIKSLRE